MPTIAQHLAAHVAGLPHKERVIARKVLILAGDTDGNLGDLAIVTATCDLLRSIDPSIRIALLTSCPERDRRRLGIVPLQRGWRGLKSLVQWARQADLVICGGGGLFQDDDSLLKMPYWALRLSWLRLFANRIAGFSIGAGPLRHPVSRTFARLGMKMLDPVSVRDALAREVLQPLAKEEVQIIPDPAFMLEPAPLDAAKKLLVAAGVPPGKRLVGVSVRQLFHKNSNLIPHKYGVKLGLHRKRGSAEMSVLIDRLAAVLNELVAHANAHIVFMPTYNVRHENDAAVCESIAGKLSGGSSTLLRLDDPKEYKAVTAHLCLMLCGRMHPAILAAGVGTPVVGLAYNQKFFGMFSLLGQDARCLSASDFVRKDETRCLTEMLREVILAPASFRPDTAELAATTKHHLEMLILQAAASPVSEEPQALGSQ